MIRNVPGQDSGPRPAKLLCMGMDGRTRLQAECTRLERELLDTEAALNGLTSGADDAQRTRLEASLKQHLVELAQVNARLSELRGPCAPP
jgi:hypothetical protein